MWFGRRKAAAAQAGGATVLRRHAVQQEAPHRLLPTELWEGEFGGLLNQLGKSPDDESNIVPTAATIDARIARDRAAHEAKLAEINREVARQTGGRVAPYFLLHEACWNGEIGDFLMLRLKLFPCDDWNVVFLPEDERTAKVMNLPVHPGGPIPGSVELVESWMRDSKAKLKAAVDEAGRTHQFAGLAAVTDGIKADVWGLASYLANHIGAAAAWKPRG
jgi:hypothetical protein